MKIAMLALITFLQMMACSTAFAEVRDAGPALVSAATDSHGVQLVQGDGKMDINVTVGEPMHSREWYSQPIWIAVFIIGGLAVLSLLVMALRGSGSGGATIVK